MAKVFKTELVYVIQGHYGRWEDLCEYGRDELREAKSDLKAYIENERQYSHRLIKRRIPNPAYKPEA